MSYTSKNGRPITEDELQSALRLVPVLVRATGRRYRDVELVECAGRMGAWQALMEWDENRGMTLDGYIHRRIEWAIQKAGVAEAREWGSLGPVMQFTDLEFSPLSPEGTLGRKASHFQPSNGESDRYLDCSPIRANDPGTAHAELRATVEAAMTALNPRDQYIVYARVWHHAEFEAIAAQVGMKRNSAQVAFRSALDKLRKRMVDCPLSA